MTKNRQATDRVHPHAEEHDHYKCPFGCARKDKPFTAVKVQVDGSVWWHSSLICRPAVWIGTRQRAWAIQWNFIDRSRVRMLDLVVGQDIESPGFCVAGGCRDRHFGRKSPLLSGPPWIPGQTASKDRVQFTTKQRENAVFQLFVDLVIVMVLTSLATDLVMQAGSGETNSFVQWLPKHRSMGWGTGRSWRMQALPSPDSGSGGCLGCAPPGLGSAHPKAGSATTSVDR